MRKINIVDRDFFGGYYRADSSYDVLCGVRQLHVVDCGYFILDGEQINVSFFQMSKQELADTPVVSGWHEPNEAAEMNVLRVDTMLQNEVLSSALSGETITPDDITFLSPSVQQLLISDLAAGVDVADIVENRSMVIIDEFLGFTVDEIKYRYPGAVFTETLTDEDGNKHGRETLRKCSWESP